MGTRKYKVLTYLKDSFLSIIYPIPSVCLSCNKELEDGGLCDKCRNTIKAINSINYIEEVPVYSCAYYSYAIKELIFNLKYRSDFNSGRLLVELAIDKIKKDNIKFDYIIFVPSSKKRLKEKGFNQCEFLAKEISKVLEVPYLDVLSKSNAIKEQKILNKAEREKNIKNAFKLKNKRILENKKVLLIDDVITTGFTIEECIRELKKISNIDLKVIILGSNVL